MTTVVKVAHVLLDLLRLLLKELDAISRSANHVTKHLWQSLVEYIVLIYK
jgi:hypothetical protein